MLTVLIASFLGGIVPSVLWLEFWLREETHKEPRRLIFGTFVLGMLSVFIAGVLEQSVSLVLVEYTFIAFLSWAFIEEVLKFTVAYKVGINTRFCDDPVDPTIYLVTSALGFSAAENILFLFEPFSNGDIEMAIMTLSARFVGATLLHIIASGIIGILIGFTFYRKPKVQKLAIGLGIILSTLLHTVFNSFIILGGQKVLWVIGSLWIGLFLVIIILEQIKKVKRIKSRT
jgi:RsiW-degrading membrane proteinase PrsW (M82 family)